MLDKQLHVHLFTAVSIDQSQKLQRILFWTSVDCYDEKKTFQTS